MNLEDGKVFHSFRRFRTAHLRKNRVPWDLQKLWLVHANKDVTDLYAEQLTKTLSGTRKKQKEREIPCQVAGKTHAPTRQNSQENTMQAFRDFP
jgi:hypothetical protein